MKKQFNITKGYDLTNNRIINKIVILINALFNILKFNNIIKIISKNKKELIIPQDIKDDVEFFQIYNKCKNFTQTSIERAYSLYKAIEYIVINEIPGDIVECGVWKGGSMMLCALTLLKFNDVNRTLYLYDTYEGMPEPSEYDRRAYDDFPAKNKYDFLKKRNIKWNYAPLNYVKKNLYSTNYPKEKIIFIKGKVEETIPEIIPKKIALLRLDTDWYESTYHELKYLFPILSKKGVLLIDDYGHWKGAKIAVDKYFQEINISSLLIRIDKTGRITIK
ncbi:MAG: TylF/MycF/NovP-related O-methyltransferase [Promethearchaeota archaeon]